MENNMNNITKQLLDTAHQIWAAAQLAPNETITDGVNRIYFNLVSLQHENQHVIYKQGDMDAPDSIKDRNGDIVLDLCKICGKGKVELMEPCNFSHDRATQPNTTVTTQERCPYCDNTGDVHGIDGEWRGE